MAADKVFAVYFNTNDTPKLLSFLSIPWHDEDNAKIIGRKISETTATYQCFEKYVQITNSF